MVYRIDIYTLILLPFLKWNSIVLSSLIRHLSIDVSQMESDHDVRLEFASFRVLIKSSMTIPFVVLDCFLSSHSFNSFFAFSYLDSNSLYRS